jgi:hypothetical protein
VRATPTSSRPTRSRVVVPRVPMPRVGVIADPPPSVNIEVNTLE